MLRMDIFKGMAEQIFKYTAYPSDSHIEEAAEVLVHAHPCLREIGTHAGHEGWKQYLKTKVANFHTKLCKLRHPEVSVNSLKNNSKGQEKARCQGENAEDLLLQTSGDSPGLTFNLWPALFTVSEVSITDGILHTALSGTVQV